ncbi:hypothetical protein BC827DRAFT_1155943 [Russula dissimulans]|nr:hypothetical protein BC827DRAFT_1155943 [Russula dissimulans]
MPRLQSVVAIAQQKFPSLNGVLVENIVLLAQIPGYPVTDQVELSREIWPSVRNDVHKVTIVLESPALHVSHNALSGVRSFSTRATAIWQPICEMDTIGLSAHDSTPIRQPMCSRGLGSPAIDVRDHYNLN